MIQYNGKGMSWWWSYCS